MTEPTEPNLPDTATVIEAFGGIRPMAQKLGVPVSTVQGWKQRNTIPQNRAADVMAAAAAHGVDLSIASSSTDVDVTAVPETVKASGEDTSPPEPVASPRSNAKPQQRNRSRQVDNRGAFLVAVVALIVSVSVGGWFLLGGANRNVVATPTADLSGVTDRLQSLEATVNEKAGAELQQQVSTEIAELRARIAQLAEVRQDAAVPDGEIDAIVARLQAAETALDQVRAQATKDAAAAAQALSAAQDEIAQLRAQSSARAESNSVDDRTVVDAVSLALAAGRLQRALESGRSYGDVLVALRALSAGDSEVDVILARVSERADTGIPTRDALARAFPGVARGLAAAASAEAANGWADRTLQRVRDTVSIRRIGADVAGDTPHARVARAEAKVLGGELAGAVAELDGLSGTTEPAAASWLGDARARLDADAAVGELEALALSRLQASRGGS